MKMFRRLLSHPMGMTAFILISKLIFILIQGIYVEADSLHYLAGERSLYHPIGYTAFCRFFPTPVWVIVVQTLLLSCSAVFFMRNVLSAHWQPWATVFVALDPFSARVASMALSEALFTSLLLISLALFQADKPISKRLGLLSALGLCTIRAAGWFVFWPMAILEVYHSIREMAWKHLLITGISLLCLYLPWGWLMQNIDGQWHTLPPGGIHLWNGASVTFVPDQHPKFAFLRYCEHFPAEIFRTEASLSLAQAWDTAFPFQRYSQQHHSIAERLAFDDSLAQCALSLIYDRPGKYFSNYVIPNGKRWWAGTTLVPSGIYLPSLPWPFRYTTQPWPSWPFMIIVFLAGILVFYQGLSVSQKRIWLLFAGYILCVTLAAVVMPRYAWVWSIPLISSVLTIFPRKAVKTT